MRNATLLIFLFLLLFTTVALAQHDAPAPRLMPADSGKDTVPHSIPNGSSNNIVSPVENDQSSEGVTIDSGHSLSGKQIKNFSLAVVVFGGLMTLVGISVLASASTFSVFFAANKLPLVLVGLGLMLSVGSAIVGIKTSCCDNEKDFLVSEECSSLITVPTMSCESNDDCAVGSQDMAGACVAKTADGSEKECVFAPCSSEEECKFSTVDCRKFTNSKEMNAQCDDGNSKTKDVCAPMQKVILPDGQVKIVGKLLESYKTHKGICTHTTVELNKFKGWCPNNEACEDGDLTTVDGCYGGNGCLHIGVGKECDYWLEIETDEDPKASPIERTYCPSKG